MRSILNRKDHTAAMKSTEKISANFTASWLSRISTRGLQKRPSSLMRVVFQKNAARCSNFALLYSVPISFRHEYPLKYSNRDWHRVILLSSHQSSVNPISQSQPQIDSISFITVLFVLVSLSNACDYVWYISEIVFSFTFTFKINSKTVTYTI